jgi:hypothetical protein
MISCTFTDISSNSNTSKCYFLVDEIYLLLIQLYESEDKVKILKSQNI